MTTAFLYETYQLILLLQEAVDLPRRGGSVFGHQVKFCNRWEANKRLMADYFDDDCLYSDADFWRKFRMRRRSLFLGITDAVEQHDRYFVQKKDATRRPGFTPIQKVTAAVRQLVYGMSADLLDDYLKMGRVHCYC